MGRVMEQIRYLSMAGLLVLVFASVGFAQYTMDLTGVANDQNWGGAYVSPYEGTIFDAGSPIYSGYIICDDYTTDISTSTPAWNVTPSNADSVVSTDKFYDGGNGPAADYAAGYTVQEDYNAIAWLANGLLANLSNSNLQIDYSYAIWEIMDPGLTTLNGQSANGPDSGVSTLITDAFNAVKNGPVYTNVTVWSPNPLDASQEFLVVGGPPVATAEASLPATLAVSLLSFAGVVFLMRRRLVRPV